MNVTPRKLLLAYLALWLMEGVLRKWVAPALQNPLYFIRVIPVAMAIVYAAGRLRRPWPLAAHVATLYVMAIATFTAIHIARGDQTIVQAVLGCRLWMEALLMPLALGPLLQRDDIELASRCVVIAAFPVAAIALAQVLSPNTAPINKLLASDGADNFMVEGGVIRATGLFTSSSGHVTFISLAMACTLTLIAKTEGSKRDTRLALVAMAVILFMMATSGSRSAVFGCSAILIAGVPSLILGRNPRRAPAIIVAAILAGAVSLWVAINMAPDVMAALASRFSGDGLVAEPSQRVTGNLLEWVDLLPLSPALGQGLGTTVMGLRNQGAATTAEVELSQWVLQLGPAAAVVAVAFRLTVWFVLSVKAVGMVRRGITAPIFFLIAGLFSGLMGPVTSQVSINGFTVLAVVFFMASSRTTNEIDVDRLSAGKRLELDARCVEGRGPVVPGRERNNA